MTLLLPPFRSVRPRSMRRHDRRGASVTRFSRYNLRQTTNSDYSPVLLPTATNTCAPAPAPLLRPEDSLTVSLKHLRDDVTHRLWNGDVATTTSDSPLVVSRRDGAVRTNRVARVMIIEADREHRHGMVVALHSSYDVEDYADGRMALDRAYTYPPDLILIDEHAIGGGLELIEELLS